MIKPAKAMREPVSAPPDRRIFLREMCPQMIAGIPVIGPRQNKLKMPRTKLATAPALIRRSAICCPQFGHNISTPFQPKHQPSLASAKA